MKHQGTIRGAILSTASALVVTLLGAIGAPAASDESLPPGGSPLLEEDPLPEYADPVAAMNRAVAVLEGGRCREAFALFDALAARYPDWPAAHANLGIAASAGALGGDFGESLEIAEGALSRALELDPDCPQALLCLGLAASLSGKMQVAHATFLKLVEIDPDDPHALYFLATTLLVAADWGRPGSGDQDDPDGQEDPDGPHDPGDPDGPDGPDGPDDRDGPDDPHDPSGAGGAHDARLSAEAALRRVIEIQPAFTSAYYRLFLLSAHAGRTELAERYRKRFAGLRGRGVVPGFLYGQGGKYHAAITCSRPPGWHRGSSAAVRMQVPAFGPPAGVSPSRPARRECPDGRDLPAAFAVADLDLDGSPEIILCGERGEDGGEPFTAVRSMGDRVALVDGVATEDPEGPPGHPGFRPLRQELPDAVLCAPGDLDADGDIDLILASERGLEVFESSGAGDLARKADAIRGEAPGGSSIAASFGFPIRLACADMDSDADLDIVALFQVSVRGGGVESRLVLLENDGDARFVFRAEESRGFGFAAAELLVADLDGDLDQDVSVLDGEGVHACILENVRGWRLVENRRTLWPRLPAIRSAALGDLDGDGLPDLVLLCEGEVRLLANRGLLRFQEDVSFRERLEGISATSAVLGDFLGAGRAGLLLLDVPEVPPAHAVFVAGPEAAPVAAPLEGAPFGLASAAVVLGGPPGGAPGGAAGGPTLIVRDADSGARAYPFAPEGGWLGVRVRGAQKRVEDLFVEPPPTCNPSGLGVRVDVCAGESRQVLQSHPAAGGAARTLGDFLFGLGGREEADRVGVRWSSAGIQAEVGLAGGQVHEVRERPRTATTRGR